MRHNTQHFAAPTEITFYERFVEDILAGNKTITIRDDSENNYEIGSTLDVFTYETKKWFCRLQILAVTPIKFEALNAEHALQENMSLTELKTIIKEIYPDTDDQLFVITFRLCP